METENPTLARAAWPAPAGSQRAYHAMIKPIGSICNLDCTYCYSTRKISSAPTATSASPTKFWKHTSVSTSNGGTAARWFFRGKAASQPFWGLDFFRTVVELEQKYKKPNQRIENDLQTNGTLLNDEWGAFLKQHGFLVGLSIDDPMELHDRYRISSHVSARSAPS